MLDLAALEAAGFTKAMTLEEWTAYQAQLGTRYARNNPASTTAGLATGTVTSDYVLERGPIRITTEQNSQDQALQGVEATIRYPEIAVVENVTNGQRAACDVTQTDLIIALADDLDTRPEPRQTRVPGTPPPPRTGAPAREE